MIAGFDEISWLGVEWRGQDAFDAEKLLEDLPDRLAEALRRILHSRRLRGKAAIPHRALSQASVILAMHDLDGQQQYADGNDEYDHRAVAGAIGVDRRQQPPRHARPAHCRTEQQRIDRVEKSDDLDREYAQQEAAGAEPDKRDAFERPGIMRVGEIRLAWPAEENHAVEFHHHIRSQSRGENERRGGERHEHVDERLRQARREQERLQQQPLGDEPVERRQAGAGESPREREPGDPRHAMDQPAELAEAALLRRVQHRARGEEEEAFEEGVIERVVERRRQGDRCEERLVVALEQDREADAGDDDADVLDRGVREQALHVGLHRREEHAEQRRGEPENQREHAPPPELALQQIEGDAQQAVDRGLEHHAAHQSGNR